MKNFIKFGLASLLISTISACSTTSHLSKTNSQATQTQTSFILVNAKKNSTESDKYFQNALITQLQKNNIVLDEKNADTEIKYDLTFNEGNRALRYFVGFGAGKATGNVKVSLLEIPTTTPLASVNTDASLSMGALGGDANTVLNNAAKDIAKKINEAEIFKKSN